MPDMNALLLRTSLGALEPAGLSCEGCRRTPLAGEQLLELESGSTLCELCFGALPEERRTAVRSERVHTSARRLAVVPKAA
jgi:hypothetical protein